MNVQTLFVSSTLSPKVFRLAVSILCLTTCKSAYVLSSLRWVASFTVADFALVPYVDFA